MTTDRRGRPVVSVHPDILREAAAYRRLPRAAARAMAADDQDAAAGEDRQPSAAPPATS